MKKEINFTPTPTTEQKTNQGSSDETSKGDVLET